MNWSLIIFKFRLKPWVNAVLGEGLSFLVTNILSLASAGNPFSCCSGAGRMDGASLCLCIDCIPEPVQAPGQLCYYKKCLWNRWRHGITSREPAALLLRGRKLINKHRQSRCSLLGSVINGMDPGAAQLQHTGLPVHPTRVQGAQLGRCLSSECSAVRDTCLQCRRINLPSGIDSSVLSFWHELITELIHWFTFWLRLNRVKGFPTDEVYTLIIFLPVRGEWEGKQYPCSSNFLLICSSHKLLLCLVKEWLIHRSSKQGSGLQKGDLWYIHFCQFPGSVSP